jgi:hypothetical protein
MKLKAIKAARRRVKEPLARRSRSVRAARADDLGDRRLRLLLATRAPARST